MKKNPRKVTGMVPIQEIIPLTKLEKQEIAEYIESSMTEDEIASFESSNIRSEYTWLKSLDKYFDKKGLCKEWFWDAHGFDYANEIESYAGKKWLKS